MEKENNQPLYFEGVGWRRETQASMLRRMEDHDYRGKSIYMLTLTTTDRQPTLGSLRFTEGCLDEAYVEPSPLGSLVERCWESIPDHYPAVKPLALQLMPDHLHGLLFVTKEQEAHLGHVVKGFKIGCTHALRALSSNAAPLSASAPLSSSPSLSSGVSLSSSPSLSAGASLSSSPNYNSELRTPPVFSPGYQDSVLTGKGQLERMFNYIADNPRRLAMKRLNPDRFRICDLQLAGRTCQAVGNRSLLSIPDKAAVIVHRRYSDADYDRLREQWLACGERGGVLVSAAIAPREKEVLREAMDRGYRIILLRENGFPEFYKPSGEAFYACADGRLLQISPWPYHTENRTISRSQCLELNAMAQSLSSIP